MQKRRKFKKLSLHLPGCYFSKEAEKTYDRSIEKFIEDNK